MSQFIEIGNALINLDEVLSVTDITETRFTSSTCAHKDKYTFIKYKNGTGEKHYSFAKKDIVEAISRFNLTQVDAEKVSE